MPKGWSITKIEDVCIFESGYAFSSESYQKEGTPLVRISNIKEGFVDIEGCVYVDSIPDSRFIIHDGDLLIAMSGATTGKMGIYHCNRPALLNQRVGNIKTISEQILRPEYRNLYLKSLESQILKDAYGGAQPNISAKDICSYYLLLPPIEEQKRIIATVDRLMSYVDAIENEEEDCKDIITKTKEKVLELAIRGKLVPQDPADEPASELLRRINPKAILSCDNPHYPSPFQIPQNWVWCLLKNICTKLVDGDHNPPTGSMMKTPYKMLSSKNINNNAIVDTDDCRFLSYEDWEMCNSRTNLAKGDVLLTTVASLGRSCVNETDIPFCFQRSVTVISTTISNYFLKFLFDSPYYQEVMNNSAKGTAQKGFYLNQVEHSLIPVPPMSEQFRIVAKINELFSELDFIEESLQA